MEDVKVGDTAVVTFKGQVSKIEIWPTKELRYTITGKDYSFAIVTKDCVKKESDE